MKILSIEKTRVPIKAWVDYVNIEQEAEAQLVNCAQMPFIYKHIAVMPDVHWGMGATVGSVIPTKGAVIPAAVGVDIGCGMCAVPTNLTASDLPDSLKEIRHSIERTIPVGFNSYNDADHLNETELKVINGIQSISDKYSIRDRKQKPEQQLGTLGGGNHFIEVCLDEDQKVWIMLHSGSRGIGNAIGMKFIEVAKNDMRQWMINLPDEDLAYLPEGTSHFDDYIEAVSWAQNYAFMNRQVMLRRVIENLRHYFPQLQADLNNTAVNCHHNYVSRENHYGENIIVTRKGAVLAREGTLGIIPGSMGAKSFIVRGKGNKESFDSCSHGAGRAMSRNEAKRRFTIEDQVKSTEGVECRKDVDVIDEIPMAYKDIDAVMKSQEDLVDIVHTLKQVLCVKG